MQYKEIELLIDALSSLPSISRKSAEKIVYFLIEQDDLYINQLVRRISDLKTNLHLCASCNDITTNKEFCSRCCDQNISKKELVVVTNFLDVEKVQKTIDEECLFFLLHSEINFKKRETSSIDQKFLQLKQMIQKNHVEEVLVATDLTINGELTANYLSSLLKKEFPSLKIYRPATGMPLNSSIDYIDLDSLKFSIKNKTKM